MILDQPVLVLDTSVILNFLGTGEAKKLLQVLPYSVVIPTAVIKEIEREPTASISGTTNLPELLSASVIQVPPLSLNVDQMALSLIGAPSPDDLDDGESYAIAYAVSLNAALGIDERKGRRIVSSRWPEQTCLFSVELLEIAARCGELTRDEFADVMFHALFYARMRVPREKVNDVVALIGTDRAAQCSSLGYLAG